MRSPLQTTPWTPSSPIPALAAQMELLPGLSERDRVIIVASSLNKGDLFFYICNAEGPILHKLATFCSEAINLRQKNYPKGD
jgi:hypothetical protein